jgi:hypothetical protein
LSQLDRLSATSLGVNAQAALLNLTSGLREGKSMARTNGRVVVAALWEDR